MEKKTNVKSILFVCLGNICRSPAAEAVMRKKIENMWPWCKDFTVDSAGIGSWHVGQLPDSRMRRVGQRHGYDVSSLARQVKSEDFSRFDLIFGMDEENMHDLNRLAVEAKRHSPDGAEPHALLYCAADFMTRHPDYHTVPDPYYGTERDFELAIELIEDACDGIIRHFMD